MNEGRDGRHLAVLGVVGVALCCGLPSLLAAGGGVVLLGVSLRSWTLFVAGAVAVAAGYELRRRHRRTGCDTPTDVPASRRAEDDIETDTSGG